MRGPDEPRESRPLDISKLGTPVRYKRRPPKVVHQGRVTINPNRRR